MLGRDTRLPQVSCPRPDPKPISEYVHHVSDTLHNTYSTMKYAHTETTAFDPLIHSKYTEGDKVWVLEAKSKLNKSDKFSPRYYGPFLVAKVMDYDTHIIASKNGKKRIEHHNRLKIARLTTTTNQNTSTDTTATKASQNSDEINSS